jgi:hypothetical protein
MAWGTHKDRREAVVAKAKTAEAKVVEHRAREASYRAQGKDEKAEKHATTARRQEGIALGHRQELNRLDARARQQAYEGLTAAQRAHEMVKAQERAAAAAAAQPEVDPLNAYLEALETAAGLEEDAVRFDKKARGYSRAGDKGKAEIALRGAEQSRSRAQEWRLEAERIQSGTSRDLEREAKLAIKARRRLESQEKNEAKRLADLGLDVGLDTAAAQRVIASGGSGRGGVKVASLSDYAGLIRKPQERTRTRLETMEKFDTLCATADAGLYPELKLERESSSGHGPGEAIMANRMAGLAEMDAISAAIGAGNVSMLRAWIYERQTLTALVRAGYGTEKTAGKLVLAAVDALAMYFKTQSALAAQVAGMGLRSQPPSSGSASRSQSEHSTPEAGRENASSEDCPAAPRRRSLELRRFWSNHLPEGDKPERPTVSCPEEISDATRHTIQALSASRVPVSR